MLGITYDALGIQLNGTLEVCDGCARSKTKLRAVRKKTYIHATNPGQRILVENNGPFPESLIDNGCRIVVVDSYIRDFWILFTKKKLKLPKKMADCF